MRSSCQIIVFLLIAIACGGNCPETSNSVFPPPSQDDNATGPQTTSESAQALAQPEDDGPVCDIPFGASMTEITQRYGAPEATSQPQEVATDYHYYGKLLIIYRSKRVDDVILQEGGQCPD